MINRFLLIGMLVICGLYSSPGIGFSQEASLQGWIASRTPFDRKIASTQLFYRQLQRTAEPAQSMDELFFVAQRFRYREDSRDNWQSPAQTQMRHAGDCEDKAIWLYAKLKSNGYDQIRFVIGKYRSFEHRFHVWLTYADERGETFLLDPSNQKKIWKLGSFSKGFYKPYFSYDDENKYRHLKNRPLS